MNKYLKMWHTLIGSSLWIFLVLLNEIKHFVSSLEVINLDEAKLHSSMKAQISKDFLKAYLLLYILTIQFF